jgi:hypothetical protein
VVLAAVLLAVVAVSGCRTEDVQPGEDRAFQREMESRYAEIADENEDIASIDVRADTLVVRYARRLSPAAFRNETVRIAQDYSRQVADRRGQESEVTVRAIHGGLTYSEARAQGGRTVSVQP